VPKLLLPKASNTSRKQLKSCLPGVNFFIANLVKRMTF
jgi:hypothetical protein